VSQHVRTCSVPGCTAKHVARGFCSVHYKREVSRAGAERRSTAIPIHLEDVEWMADTGETWLGAASRLGVHPKTLERRLHRDGRYDLVTRLRSRETSTRPTQGDTAA
jgi:hypothetical protein